jgi:hypothetical protein
VIKGSEFSVEFTALQTAFSLAAPAASPTFTGTVTIPTADINGGNIDGTVIGAATPAAGSFTTFTSTGIDDNATSTAITIDASENVGIGTISPSGALHVSRSGLEAGITLERTTSATAKFTMAANDGNLVFTDQNQSAERMRIDSSGNVGIGVTPSAWGSPFSSVMQFTKGAIAGQSNSILLLNNAYFDGTNYKYISTAGAGIYEQTNGIHLWQTAASGTAGTNISFSESMRIDSSGNVGIGTTSPAGILHLQESSGGNVELHMRETSGATNYGASIDAFNSSGGGLRIRIHDSGGTLQEVIRFKPDGTVGIGTTSPSTTLSVQGGSANGIELDQDSDLSTDSNRLFFTTSGGSNAIYSSSGALRFTTGATAGASSGTERMRIDSSGNLLVGTTDNNVYNDVTGTGTVIQSNGIMQLAASSGTPLYLNRQTSDGEIVSFRKDGSTVGSIGVDSNNLYIANTYSGTKAGLKFGGNITPMEGGADADGQTDLGSSSIRFKDLYLSGGVYLGGTGAGNLLDDYEEGTWTPTCVCSGQTITTTQAIGKYTKIGRIVHAECAIIINTVSGTASGATTITGLPFTNDGDGYSGMGALNYNDGFVNTLYASWIQSTTAYMRSGTRSQSNDGGGFSAGGYINIRWSYITNA